MASTKTEGYQAPALDKGLDILEFLADAAVPQSQTQIAQGLGREPHEIFRMLTRLRARGYLLRDELSGKYELSLKLFQLSRTHSPIESLAGVARPVMRRLAEEVGQSCHLCILDGGELLVICQVRSPLPVSISVAEGARFDPLTTTSGRLLLGVMPAADQRAALAKQRTWRAATPARRKLLRDILDQAAAKRRLILASEVASGVTDVSVLVGKSTALCASLSITCIGSPDTAVKEDANLLTAALAAAQEINHATGADG